MNYKDFLPQPIGCGFYEKINSWKSRELKEHCKLFFIGLLLLIPFGLFAQAESEPNDTTATADAIAFGSTGSGAIIVGGEQDWWVLTTTENGKITVDFSSTSGQTVTMYLLSSNSTQLAAASTASNNSITRDGLAPGTYYVRVIGINSYVTPNYTLSPIFTEIAQNNDQEPNNSVEDAQIFDLNSTSTGHIGYREFNENSVDSDDWYSVTTDADGELEITLTSHLSGQTITFQIFDGDGTSLLVSGSTGTTATISKNGLAPGEYFVRVYPINGSVFAPYTLTNNLILPLHPTEGSGNDTFSTAQEFALNSSVNGLIGYRYNGNVDSQDWYSVTTDADGELEITLTNHLSGQTTSFQIFDGNGTSVLVSGSTATTRTISKNGLAPGEYFVRVYPINGSVFAPYTLTNNLILPLHPTEGSGNDTFSTAQEFALNSSVNGLIGYRYNGNVDSQDWYSVTTNADGELEITLTNHLSGQTTSFQIFDGNGTSVLVSGSTATTTTISKNGLAPGEYFVRVYPINGSVFAPYTLENELIIPPTPNDATDNENDSSDGANELAMNIPNFGHIGYRYNGDVDQSDWYSFQWTAQADFRVNLKVNNGQTLTLRLYQSNGTSQISSMSTSTTNNINVSNLAAGNYFLRVTPINGSVFAPYRLSTGIDTDDDGYADVVDCAPDDATAWQEGTFYIDADGDGYHGVEEVLCYGDEAPAGYVDTTLGLDCDDEMAEVYPGAEEICDGIDNNCDGQIDEGVQSTWYADADGDGFGDAENSMQACTQPEGYVADNTDCDDTNAEINPNATELPGNGIDEDCDGSDGTLPDVDGDGVADDVDNCPSIANADQADLDEDGLGDACDDDADGDGFTNDVDCDDMDANIGLGEMWYADADGDGFGDEANSMQACTQPEGYVADNTDCDDTNAEINPNATEIAGNEIDENCDGIVETSDDTDGDGVADDIDNCLNTYNPGQEDTDSDGVGDACAECSEPYNVSIMRTSDTTATFTAGNAIWHYQGTANRAGRPLRARPMYGMTDMQVPHTQNALVPSFAYDTWFRTICPEGGYSDWVGPFYLPVFTVDSKGLPELTIYPNPTMGEIRFEKAKIKMVQVYDSNGAMMFEIKVENNHLDLTRLQSGTYNLILTDADGNKYQEQVIKK